MEERITKRLWVAGTAVVSSTAFIVLGIMFGGSPLRWDIHVIFVRDSCGDARAGFRWHFLHGREGT